MFIIDLEACTWQEVPTRDGATRPVERYGHSATVVGDSTVWVFGGEDANGNTLPADVFSFNLETLLWTRRLDAVEGPGGRAFHTAAAFQRRFVLLWGGEAPHGTLAELLLLDTVDCRWLAVHAAGTPPCARAGHAGAVLGDCWYVAGGTTHGRGLRDLHALHVDVHPPPTDDGAPWLELEWREVDAGDDHAGVGAGNEGLTLVAVVPAPPAAPALLAYGGYSEHGPSANVHVFTPGWMVAVAAAVLRVTPLLAAAPPSVRLDVGAALADALLTARRFPLLFDANEAVAHQQQAQREALELQHLAREAAHQV